MSHTPYGYKIENGIAVIDEEKADKIRFLYESYLSGLSLSAAAKKAEIKAYHGMVGKMLKNKCYLEMAIIRQLSIKKHMKKLKPRW